MAEKIFYPFLTQVLLTVVIIVVFGFLISLINKQFYANFGRHATRACYVTGIIGTPVHELSHAIFCIIFMHKIVEIKLFQISEDGTLGYVKHTYNRKNLYARIGNFFIGVAPIIVISAILYLLAYLLLPDFVASTGSFTGSAVNGDMAEVFASVVSFVGSFFSLIGTWQWWVFMLAGLFLSLHMTLSKADADGALSGLFFLLILLLAADAILALTYEAGLAAFTGWIVYAGSYLLCFLVISLMISVILLLVSFVARIFIK